MSAIDLRLLPKPAFPDRAEIGLARWRDAAGSIEDGAALRRVAGDEAGRAVLAALSGNSPYLGDLLVRNPLIAAEAILAGPDAVYPKIAAEVLAGAANELSHDRVMAVLRHGKGKVALLVALADIAGLWPLEKVTRALSDFADLSLQMTIRCLLRQFAAGGVFDIPEGEAPELDAGLTILALGKLGGQELNYSSDIDLMVFYERQKLRSPDPDSLPQQLVRLVRQMMRGMDERTADGYVFRTDLRLRPDPGATPLAIPIAAAESYYESVGQNWERAAMIRARAAAGDIRLGEAFLDHLRPFIWRKHLDFAAIQDIHSIKRQITAYRGGAAIAVNGHDIKLGRGGIREIEFFAQTQQLIWGGRFPSLRTRQVIDTLGALADLGRIERSTAQEMAEAYRYLRRLEHRLQMVNDHQTHALPKTDAQIEHIALFMGYPDGEAFRKDLLARLGGVESHYAELFEEEPGLGGAGALVFTGAENHPETVQTLEGMGFSDGGSVSTMIRRWHHGRYRATRSVRSRELLTELMPRLLQAFAERTNPGAALARFDAFLAALPSGVQLFSLFYANPILLNLVAEIMGDAPTLADWLSRNPHLLDNVLTGDFYAPPEDADGLRAGLETLLREARDFQDVLDITRRWANDRKFQVGVQILRGISDGHATGPVLSDVAETVIRALWPHVEREFAGPGGGHGRMPGGELAVMALGKLGGRELMPQSDLDLVFVYDVPEDADPSDGEKPLSSSVYYMRLSQRIVGAIEALTGEGRLYEVDVRLRPSGNKGPSASRLDGYIRYFEDSAWTWEHMALTRARTIAGSPSLMRRLDGIIRDTLTRPRDPGRLAVDVADMRARMAREFRGTSRWDIKHRRGGLVDAEFIAQYLQLLHAAEHPEILSPNAVTALASLSKAGLLDAGIAADLIDSLQLWHRIQTVMRVTTSDALDDEASPEGPRNAVVHAAGVESFAALTARMDETATRVHAHFAALIDAPADLARPLLPGKDDRKAEGA
ncbi:MAG: bifunctional [glutamine synthetase] adenylyltransferase/[glutamine synthetase]-adenylyl-L-tyrosine phosphorylase [Alphaproteobacteria bacterium]|nr:bifunctional [glutamine synthetase] adenylyltransferase/[glutamine synthetase]-adenylyl-L-tyrosine phosphorylase [Alphaproteobacteria bacterium]